MRAKGATASRAGPELVIGLVGAIGTDMVLVFEELKSALADLDYTSQQIHLISLVEQLQPKTATPSTLDVRYEYLMDLGNEFCEAKRRADAIAVLGIGQITWERQRLTGDARIPAPRYAYVLSSLKRPEEVTILRDVYGPCFLLISVYSPRQHRLDKLTEDIKNSYKGKSRADYREMAEHLIRRDESEQAAAEERQHIAGVEYGQNVQSTFPLADIFIDASDNNRLRVTIGRCVDLFFGSPFITPTRDEYAMFHAQAAALRSADLSRQVGAAIMTKGGDVVSLGTNEVPKSGGGMYWADDTKDGRDFEQSANANTSARTNMLAEVIERFRQAGCFSDAFERMAKRRPERAMEEALKFMKNSQLMDVSEFGRTQHAEMAALLDAARLGVPVQGCTLYTTTFPCHNCTRHLISAGIDRVVYVEPYPKSRAADLHADSVIIDPSGVVEDKVKFEPFVGVSPRRYMELFTFSRRQRTAPGGKPVHWKNDKRCAQPNFTQYAKYFKFYLFREIEELTRSRALFQMNTKPATKPTKKTSRR